MKNLLIIGCSHSIYVEKYGKKDYINNIIDTGHHLNNIAQEKVLDFLEPELKEFLEQ
jgi:hypothetical protein